MFVDFEADTPIGIVKVKAELSDEEVMHCIKYALVHMALTRQLAEEGVYDGPPPSPLEIN